jgi:small subunit ribosomal protein S4
MQAKNLVTVKSLQVEKERNQLLTKLCSLGLLGKDAKIEDVLSLTLKDIMERRLQTLVYRKNMASSIKQARQFIIHEHIVLSDKTITAPSYMVPLVEENSIQFAQDSVLSNPSHPERAAVKMEKASKKSKEKEQEGEVEAKGKSKEKETKSEKKPKEKKKEVPTTHDLKKEKRIRKKQEKKPEVGKK